MMGELSQRELILQSPSRRIVVLACPGSGKTSTLTEKIIRLSKEKGVSLKRVLSVTFTRKAAGEMLDRIKTEIPVSKSERRNICTLHSFGTRVLFKYRDLAGLEDGYTIADKPDCAEIVRSILPEESQSESTIDSFLKYVSNQKNGIPTGECSAICTVENFDAYCAAMVKANLIDVDDLVYLPVQILSKNETVRKEVASRFDYIFVDEYQDINRMQDRFLSLLIRDETYVMYVGDDDQSIYEFRGSKSDFILEKSQLNSGYDVFFLTTNYRSQKPIVEFSKKVLTGIISSLRQDKKIVAAKVSSTQKPIRHAPFATKKDETDYVAGEIKRLICESSVVPKEIAVLSRYGMNNQYHTELSSIAGTLGGWGIPVFSGFSRDGDVMESKTVKAICSILALLKKGNVQASNMNLIEPNAYQKKNFTKVIDAINSKCSSSLLPEEDFLALMGKVKGLSPDLEPGLKTRLERYIQIYDFLSSEVARVAEGAMPSQVITDTLMFFESRGRKIETTRYIYENAFSFAKSCEDALEQTEEDGYSSVVASLNAFLCSESKSGSSDGVSLITAHQSKGLQFDVVFIVGLEAGSFPCNIEELTDDAMDNERRLFYVCVTRARELLYLTATAIADDSKVKDLASKTFIYNVPDTYFADSVPSFEDISFSSPDPETLERLQHKDEVIQELETNYEVALEKLRASDERIRALQQRADLSDAQRAELDKARRRSQELLNKNMGMKGMVETQATRIAELERSLADLKSRIPDPSEGEAVKREQERALAAIEEKLRAEQRKRSEAEAMALVEKKKREESEKRLAQESTAREEIEAALEESRRVQSEAINTKNKVESEMDSLLAYPSEVLPVDVKNAVIKIYGMFVRSSSYPVLRQYFLMAISGFEKMVVPCAKYKEGTMGMDVFMSFVRSCNYKGRLDLIVRGILTYFETGSAQGRREFNLGVFIENALGNARDRRYQDALNSLKRQGYNMAAKRPLLEDMRVLNALTSGSSHGGNVSESRPFASMYKQLKDSFLARKERMPDILGSYFLFIALFLRDEDIFRMMRID